MSLLISFYLYLVSNICTSLFSQAYTNLYSLHTFDWRNPESSTPQVSDTAIIKSIYTKIEELKTRPTPPIANEQAGEGISVIPLLRSALAIFDHLETFRLPAIGKRQRRRHLILILRSPLVALDQLEAEAAVLSGAVIAENVPVVPTTTIGKDQGVGDDSDHLKSGDSETVSKQKGVLESLRELLVAVSIFSPIEDKGFRKLAQICNMLKPDIRRDQQWPTVIFSREISQLSLSQRSSVPPHHANRRVAEPSGPPPAKRFQTQAGYPSHQPVPVGSKEPSPRQMAQPVQQQQQVMHHQQTAGQQQQQQQQQMTSYMNPTGVMHHPGGPGGGMEPSALNTPQSRMVSYECLLHI